MVAHFFLPGTIASLAAFARIFTTVLAGIFIASPVAGLRAMRAFLFTRTSFPIPGRGARPYAGKLRQWSVLIPTPACPKISLLGPISVSPTPARSSHYHRNGPGTESWPGWVNLRQRIPKIHLRLSHRMNQRHEDLLLHPQELPHRLLHLAISSLVAHPPDTVIDPLGRVKLFFR